MKEIAYYDGKFGLPSQITIPLEERGFMFGEAVYEMMAVYNHVIWALDDHIFTTKSFKYGGGGGTFYLFADHARDFSPWT